MMASTSTASTVFSSISPKPSHNVNDLKNLLDITITSNVTNYLLWAQSFTMFVVSQKKKHIFDAPLPSDSASYNDWVAADACVMI